MKPFLQKPSTDFGAVRDGRTSMPLWLDIDLSVSRSITGTGANAALSVNIAGNSFYIDQDTANVGTATVHFQDTNLGAASAPLFVSAGFIANVPFTQLLIENTAQAGKRLRIFYGVDIDFQAGINASIAISGNVGLTGLQNAVYQTGTGYGASYQSLTAMAANAPATIFAPGSNPNGAIIHAAAFKTAGAGGNHAGAFVANSSAPISVIDGEVIVLGENIMSVGGYTASIGKLPVPIKIPAGKGLYYINNGADAGYAFRHVLYTLL